MHPAGRSVRSKLQGIEIFDDEDVYSRRYYMYVPV